MTGDALAQQNQRLLKLERPRLCNGVRCPGRRNALGA
jgi:hypothetical protein